MKDSSFQPLAWSTSFNALERAVTSGQHLEGRKILDELSPKSIPREWAHRYAQLANRIHHSIFALKSLHRFISPEGPMEKPASDDEKMIYAYALCNLGATDEALEILNSVDAAQKPDAYFLKSLTLFRDWNFSQSIPLLKKLLVASEVSPYRKLVGEVNLVAALIGTGDWNQARERLRSIQETCRKDDHTLLLGNSYELEAQALFFLGNYDEALRCLHQAHELLKDQKGLYLLFVEKWTAICHAFKDGSLARIQAVRDVKFRALALEDPETVRECELFEAVLTQNEDLLRKVIMGTPSEHYRQRARQLFQKAVKPFGHYSWDLSEGAHDASPVFDPYEKQNGRSALFEKPQLLALFLALTRDFYKPVHLGGIFKSVYPLEKFNPYTSPARVLQLLKRLDGWFRQHEIPLRVDFKKSEFSLKATAPLRVLVQRGKRMSATEGRWSEIKALFEGRTFTTSKISETTGISKASAQRLVKEAIAEGKVQCIGRGRNVRYKFQSKNKGSVAA